MILPKHSAWLEKGPDERFPTSSIAYQPGLMQRTVGQNFINELGRVHLGFPCAVSKRRLSECPCSIEQIQHDPLLFSKGEARRREQR
jgi:hypothetical protein